MSGSSHPRVDAGRLVLFVTGDAPRSRRARANLQQALETLGSDGARPREIDLLQEPEQSLSYGVFATPALVRLGDDDSTSVLYGDLSEAQRLHHFLADGIGPPEAVP